MNCDYLGQKIEVGTDVVGLVYRKTSASFEKGIVLDLTPKTAKVKMNNGNIRRFNNDKLINISRID